ncbi:MULTISPECIES: MbtH family protein [Micromonospora]|uniref:MbtH protein n=1 Tax=Micromonospora rifamycinica TaxID=291594 RepID=A0A1C5J288_9ACTN|nr:MULTISPECIES: MbtH family protein [Micromonospora]WFE96134.1 MbtH family protein [Micromonospora sp. WMMD987]SCG64718.1 MbtH protein [Micromonospora rifamycinica]
MNPFDDENARFMVLVNDEGQHCLWPVFAEVPAGWTVALADAGRAEALAWVETNWVDMRPRSLVEAMRSGELPDVAPRT